MSSKPKPPRKKTIYRNSESGRITTKEYAEKNPKTTEKEQVRKSS